MICCFENSDLILEWQLHGYGQGHLQGIMLTTIQSKAYHVFMCVVCHGRALKVWPWPSSSLFWPALQIILGVGWGNTLLWSVSRESVIFLCHNSRITMGDFPDTSWYMTFVRNFFYQSSNQSSLANSWRRKELTVKSTVHFLKFSCAPASPMAFSFVFQ